MPFAPLLSINTQSRLAAQALSGNALDLSMLMIDVAKFSLDQVKLYSELIALAMAW